MVILTFNRLLENERHLSSELRQTLDQEHENQHTLVLRFQNTIADLQANLDVERSKVLELASRIERDRCQNLAADEEKSLLEEKLLSESSACNQLRQSVANLTVGSAFAVFVIFANFFVCFISVQMFGEGVSESRF